MKKIVGMLTIMTLCMAVIPLAITAFADVEAVKYIEDMTANIISYLDANSADELLGTSEMQGTYGKFTHRLQNYCAIQNNGGYRLSTYNKNTNVIEYSLDNVEDNHFVDLRGATISVAAKNNAGDITRAGSFEVRYLYVSDSDYFSVILDYVNSVAYIVEMRNGIESRKAIKGGELADKDAVSIELGIDGTAVNYNIYSSGGNFEASGNVEISNIDFLSENSTQLSQFRYTASDGGLNFVWVKDVSYTCSLKDKISYGKSKAIGDYYADNNELKILAQGVAPRSSFKYGTIEMSVSDNNISCTQTVDDSSEISTYIEDLATHIDAYNQENSTTEILGAVSLAGTYGTFNHRLPTYSSVKNDNGWRISTYSTELNTVDYTLDRIENMRLDVLSGAAVDIYSRGQNDLTENIGEIELCYLYVSEDNYFSILMDYANNKTYSIVKNNGAEEKTEISGVELEHGKTASVRLNINGTMVSFNVVGSATAGSYDVTREFEVENIDYLNEKCTRVSKFRYTPASGGLNMMWLKNVSYTCSVKPIDIRNSMVCFGTGVHSRPAMFYTMNITNENKDYSKLKFDIRLKNGAAYDDFWLNFGYVPWNEDPEKNVADFDSYRRHLLYGYDIDEYLSNTNEWQTVEIPLSVFTAEVSNKFAVPGTSNNFTWERVDWKNFNLIMLRVSAEAENQGFELKDVSVITPQIKDCTAEFILTNSAGDVVKDLSDVKGTGVGCYIRAYNNKDDNQEIMPVLLVYKNDRLVDIITNTITARANETTSGYVELFDVPKNTDGFRLKLFLAEPNNILNIRSDIVTCK